MLYFLFVFYVYPGLLKQDNLIKWNLTDRINLRLNTYGYRWTHQKGLWIKWSTTIFVNFIVSLRLFRGKQLKNGCILATCFLLSLLFSMLYCFVYIIWGFIIIYKSFENRFSNPTELMADPIIFAFSISLIILMFFDFFFDYLKLLSMYPLRYYLLLFNIILHRCNIFTKLKCWFCN